MRILARAALSPRIGAALLAALLAGTAPASAEDGGGSHPLDSALEMLNLKTEAGPMPDFVTQDRGSKPAGAYLPVGAKPPSRAIQPASAAGVKALTAELDAARDAQLAGKRPKPMSTGAAGSAKAAAKAAGKPLRLQTGGQATNR